jgi:hypothetical protein
VSFVLFVVKTFLHPSELNSDLQTQNGKEPI